MVIDNYILVESSYNKNRNILYGEKLKIKIHISFLEKICT